MDCFADGAVFSGMLMGTVAMEGILPVAGAEMDSHGLVKTGQRIAPGIAEDVEMTNIGRGNDVGMALYWLSLNPEDGVDGADGVEQSREHQSKRPGALTRLFSDRPVSSYLGRCTLVTHVQYLVMYPGVVSTVYLDKLGSNDGDTKASTTSIRVVHECSCRLHIASDRLYIRRKI